MYWTTKMFKQLEAQIQSFFPVSREEARGWGAAAAMS